MEPTRPSTVDAYRRLDATNISTFVNDYSSTTIQHIKSAISENRTLQRTLNKQLQLVKNDIDSNRKQALTCSDTTVRPHSVQCDIHRADTIDPKCYKRRWTKRFFVDHNGLEPNPNADTIRRRELELSTFFYHTQPPWSSKETASLMNIVKEISQSWHQHEKGVTREPSTNDTGDSVSIAPPLVDFQRVATILNQSIHPIDQLESTRKRKIKQFLLPQRNAEECKIQYESTMKQNNSKGLFKSKEVLSILSNAVTSMVSKVGPLNINWDIVGEEVSNSLAKEGIDNYRYTAYDCLLAYHSKLKTPLVQLQTTSSNWTLQEDEMIFKFIAAAGPQAVIESKNALIQNTLCAQLLTNKSKKQIFARANHSLLNPNMKRNEWTDYEERRLAICMKIYSSSTPEDGSQLYCASTHCVGRSSKSVTDKWNRSINPEYSTRPFTRDEDKILLQVMRSSFEQNEVASISQQPIHIGWTELSQKYFPNRHPQRLQNRWSELASDDDIINREKSKLLYSKVVAGDTPNS